MGQANSPLCKQIQHWSHSFSFVGSCQIIICWNLKVAKNQKKIPMRAFLIRFDDFSRKNCIQRLEVGRGGLYEKYGGNTLHYITNVFSNEK